MVDNLNGLVVEIKINSKNLLKSSTILANTSNNVSQNSANQSSIAEEISSSIEQMVATIEKNTENAKITEHYAKESELNIGNTQKASYETLISMKEIADKIYMIQDISRKTNLLAINAAI